MAKITINGQEYNFEQPEDIKKFIAEHLKTQTDANGIPKTFNGINVISANGIFANGKTYKSFNDLPLEMRQKLQDNFNKLHDNVLAKKIMKMYGVDLDKIPTPNLLNDQNNNENTDNSHSLPTIANSMNTKNNDGFNMPKGSNSNDSQFGGSSFSGSTNSQPNQSNPIKMYKAGGGGSGKWIVILIVIVIIGFVGGLVFFIGFVGQSWGETYALTSDPTHFDPFVGVSEVRNVIDPNAKLSSITADYVQSDGTMDLTATSYRANVDYQFYKELAQPPKDAPPIGAGGSATGKWYEPVSAEVYRPGEWRNVSQIGGGVNTEYSYSNKGIDLESGTPTASPDGLIDDPKCSIKDFWKTAVKQGAPEEAVASVTYDQNGYDFEIRGTGIYLNFDKDCKLADNNSVTIDEPTMIDAQTEMNAAESQAQAESANF